MSETKPVPNTREGFIDKEKVIKSLVSDVVEAAKNCAQSGVALTSPDIQGARDVWLKHGVFKNDQFSVAFISNPENHEKDWCVSVDRLSVEKEDDNGNPIYREAHFFIYSDGLAIADEYLSRLIPWYPDDETSGDWVCEALDGSDVIEERAITYEEFAYLKDAFTLLEPLPDDWPNQKAA